MGLFRKSAEPEVSPTSPAALLAKSLTDPETRSEWERSTKPMFRALATEYRNKGRDLTITRVSSVSVYSSGTRVYTPFTLNKPEERVVRDALRAFEKHLSDERERAALSRLVTKGKSR